MNNAIHYPGLARMERRIHRATRHAWSGFFLLSLLIVMAGAWIGYAAHDIYYGMLIAAGIDVICVGYAWMVAPLHLKRFIRARQGLFPEKEERVQQLLTPLCEKAGIKMPGIFIISTRDINAMAAGFLASNQYIGITEGAMNTLTDHELSAVLAHEVSHIVRKDTLIAGWWIALMGVIAGVSIILFTMGISSELDDKQRYRRVSKQSHEEENSGIILALAAIVFGVIAILLVQLWLKADSRRREVLADEHAILLTGNALPLATALEQMRAQTLHLRTPASLSMFFAVTPSHRSWWVRLFDTHPDISWRIQKLRAIAQEMGEQS